jgi:hypothetical protein
MNALRDRYLESLREDPLTPQAPNFDSGFHTSLLW